MGVLEIFFIGVLEIFYWCPGGIYWCPGDIWFVSWKYLMGVLEIYDRGSVDI